MHPPGQCAMKAADMQLDESLDEFLRDSEAFEVIAAALDHLAAEGATREEAIEALVRWVRATAEEYQG